MDLQGFDPTLHSLAYSLHLEISVWTLFHPTRSSFFGNVLVCIPHNE